MAVKELQFLKLINIFNLVLTFNILNGNFNLTKSVSSTLYVYRLSIWDGLNEDKTKFVGSNQLKTYYIPQKKIKIALIISLAYTVISRGIYIKK